MNMRRRRAAGLLVTAICALAFPSTALAGRSEGRGGGGKSYRSGGGGHGSRGGHASRGQRQGRRDSGSRAGRQHGKREGRHGGRHQVNRRGGDGGGHQGKRGGSYGGRHHGKRDGSYGGRHNGKRYSGRPYRGYSGRHYYGHSYYYPRHGHHVYRLPRNYFTISFGGYDNYYYGGVWYRPYRYGFGYVVAAAPLGAVVSVLPPYYSTVWVSDVPYYYANYAYYRWSPPHTGYVVVADPGVGVPESSAVDDFFVYPNADQSEEQQADDRYACHRWAADQTDYDPSLGGSPDDESTRPGLRADYLRAMTACLEGRDYTVK